MAPLVQQYEFLLVDVDAGVATVTLNRPERRNAFTGRMHLELNHAFASLEADDAVRVIVVTGAGRDFCSGADLSARGMNTFNGDRPAEEVPTDLDVPAIRPWEMSTIIIAAINGSAVGVGLTMPVQWDIRIVALDAKLGFVFNRRGISPEYQSSWLLPRLIGVSRATELMLTGRIFSGEEAAAIGLASRAVPADQVLPVAVELAREIAEHTAPASAAVTKRLINHGLVTLDRPAVEALENDSYRWLGGQPDAREGVTAFLEKRRPVWSMSKRHDLPPFLPEL